MRVLLLGARGQLGTDLRRSGAVHEIIAPAREALDITDAAAVRDAIAAETPDVVINCAAFHDVPRCETEPLEAFRVNVVAVRDLAAACAERDIRLVTFSTDYVFGGEQATPYAEDATPHPLQMYGITRLAGEHAARAVAPDHALVVRTCGLYGSAGSASRRGNFVDNRVADARAGRDLEIASEQVVAPTSTHDLARATWQLLASPAATAGIYHLVNEGACSWYQLTQAIYDQLETTGTVRPVDRGGRTGAMRRPRYSVLANTRARALGITLRPWREALTDYLHTTHPEVA